MLDRGMDREKADQAARAICVKSTGLKWQRHTSLTQVPIQEVGISKEEENRYVYLAGIALRETVSRNHINYRKEVLKKGYHTLEGKKVFPNHNYDQVPVGKVVYSGYRESEDGKGEIEFVMEIDSNIDQKIVNAIESGYINSVSIGADGGELICDICNRRLAECKHIPGKKYIIEGEEVIATASPTKLEFKELSLVYFMPGIEGATIFQADEYIPQLKEIIDKKIVKGDKMSENIDMLKGEIEALTKQNQDLKTKYTEVLEKLKQMEDIEKKRQEAERKKLINEVIKLETELYPEKYPADNIPERAKEYYENDKYTTDYLEGMILHLKKEIESRKELEMLKEKVSPKSYTIQPPTNQSQLSEEERKIKEIQEIKRLIERKLKINKPLDPKFKEYMYMHGLYIKVEGDKVW